MHTNREIVDLANKILNTAAQHENRKRGLGDISLRASELRFIGVIREEPDINITDMATYLGISKSAVSKMSSSLEKKGLLERYHSPNNQKDVLLRLTSYGIRVDDKYKEIYAVTFQKIHERLSSYTDEERAAIARFLNGFYDILIDRY